MQYAPERLTKGVVACGAEPDFRAAQRAPAVGATPHNPLQSHALPDMQPSDS